MANEVKIVSPVTITSGILTVSNVADETAWLTSTAYVIGDKRSYASKLYSCILGVTGTVTPDLATSNWVYVSASNKFRMFDASNTSQSTNTNTINVRITPAATCTTVALFNIEATTVLVTMVDPVAGIVFNQTYTMRAPPKIVDHWNYIFDPIIDGRDLIVDLPPYLSAYTDVTLTKTAATVKCGTMILGSSNLFGSGIAYGASLGIVDYSTKEKDVFGNYNIVPRSFSKRASFSIWLDNNEVDPLINLLSDLRTTPTLYIATTQFTSAAIFGYYKDFDINIQYQENSVCNLQIEGLS